MKYKKILESISSGRLDREKLAKIRRNAESKLKAGDIDAQSVIDAINISVPSDDYILFMGFCPDGDVKNRLDRDWKEKGICCFDWDESQRQMERFHTICAGDLVILKKRAQFGKTMNLYGYGRVEAISTDTTGHRYLKMNWSNQDQIIEVPLMGANSTVDIKSMSQVEEQMPKEFFKWLED
jgi:hypothetical protein